MRRCPSCVCTGESYSVLQGKQEETVAIANIPVQSNLSTGLRVSCGFPAGFPGLGELQGPRHGQRSGRPRNSNHAGVGGGGGGKGRRFAGKDLAVAQKTATPKWLALVTLVSGNMDQNLRFVSSV